MQGVSARDGLDFEGCGRHLSPAGAAAWAVVVAQNGSAANGPAGDVFSGVGVEERLVEHVRGIGGAGQWRELHVGGEGEINVGGGVFLVERLGEHFNEVLDHGEGFVHVGYHVWDFCRVEDEWVWEPYVIRCEVAGLIVPWLVIKCEIVGIRIKIAHLRHIHCCDLRDVVELRCDGVAGRGVPGAVDGEGGGNLQKKTG